MHACRKFLGSLLVMLALATPSAASAQGGPCWRQVVDDWWDNGRVDGVYAPECYRQALDRLPEDMEAYSSAPDDISRALTDVLRDSRVFAGGPDLPGGPADPNVDRDRAAERAAERDFAGSPSGNDSTDGEDDEAGGGSPGSDDSAGSSPSRGVFHEALDRLGPNNASSFPLPLAILGAIALLLLAFGALGFIKRRLQPRRVRAR